MKSIEMFVRKMFVEVGQSPVVPGLYERGLDALRSYAKQLADGRSKEQGKERDRGDIER